MHATITARLLVKSHTRGTCDNDGKSAAITLGNVSPMITQKATIPPKALKRIQSALAFFVDWLRIQCKLSDGNRNKSGSAKALFHGPNEYKYFSICHRRMLHNVRLKRVGTAEFRIDHNQAA